MNHCGRPTCECYKEKCCGKCVRVGQHLGKMELADCIEKTCSCHTEKPVQNYERDHSHIHCYLDQKGHEEHLRCCICYKEKPVKKKPHRWREGYCVHGNKLDFDCGGCRQDAERMQEKKKWWPEYADDIKTPAAPLGDWEEEFDKLVDQTYGYIHQRGHARLKSYIRSLLVSEREKQYKVYSEMEAISVARAEIAERERIEVEVGKMRSWANMDGKELLDAVLRIIRGEGIKG